MCVLITVVANHVLFTPFTGKVDLFLTFTKAVFVRLGCFIRALVTGNARFIFRALFIFGQDGTAACIAQLMWTFPKRMTNRNARIKDETITLPFAFGLWHLFQVF